MGIVLFCCCICNGLNWVEGWLCGVCCMYVCWVMGWGVILWMCYFFGCFVVCLVFSCLILVIV